MARRAPFLAALAVISLALAASDASAKRKRRGGGERECRKAERYVDEGTPVLGGPGLGFETVEVVRQGRCARVLQETDDGSFALILVESDKVGWVATGLVDASLSEQDDDVKPLPFEPTQRPKLKAVEGSALRAEPRFDAAALRALKPGEALTALGASPDAQWLYVSAGQGQDDKGWIPKYQAADELPAPGSRPSAGTSPWAPQKAEMAPGATTPPDPEEQRRAAREQKKLEGLDVVLPPPAPEPPLLGRRQSIAARARAGYWRQDYASDAQDDAFARYAVQSAGGGISASYSFRDDSPLVFDVGFTADQFGFGFALPDGGEAYTLATAVDLRADAGWRLHTSRIADVEARGGLVVDAFLLGDLVGPAGPIPAFASGVFFGLRPSVQARSRIDEGRLGMIVVEAGVPLGGYKLLPDPADRYVAQADQKVPDELRPDGGPPPEVELEPAAQETTWLHFGLGADGRIGYVVGLTEAILLDVGGTVGVRQALIEGPGLRTGAYAQASTVDLWIGLEAGLAWAF